RTPVGGGALLRQDFVLKKSSQSNSNGNSTTQLAQPAPSPASAQLTAATAAGSPSKTESVPSPSGDGARTAQSQIKNPGTYEVASTETVAPVAPGEVLIVSPALNSVAMNPGLDVEVRTAISWNVKLEVNGEQISDKNIGVSRLDRKNQISTFSFVGISIRPGVNRIRATAVGPNAEAGHSAEINVMGRGPARSLN